MQGNSIELIEAWFTENSNDGEFSYARVARRNATVEPAAKPSRVVFATKHAGVARAIEELGADGHLGLIGGYGLPSRADLNGIQRSVGDRDVLFLGDMDPVDLMIFAWLRGRLRHNRVTHLGVNEAYLEAIGVQLPESFVISCSASERQSMALLREVLPDFHAIVGRRFARMLDDGRKIEFEAVISALPVLTPSLARAVLGI